MSHRNARGSFVELGLLKHEMLQNHAAFSLHYITAIHSLQGSKYRIPLLLFKIRKCNNLGFEVVWCSLMQVKDVIVSHHWISKYTWSLKLLKYTLVCCIWQHYVSHCHNSNELIAQCPTMVVSIVEWAPCPHLLDGSALSSGSGWWVRDGVTTIPCTDPGRREMLCQRSGHVERRISSLRESTTKMLRMTRSKHWEKWFQYQIYTLVTGGVVCVVVTSK